jgi:hypothetical protein
VPGVAERLLAVLLDGSPVLFGLGLLGLFALDVRTHVVIPVLRACGRRWANRIAASPVIRARPRRHRANTGLTNEGEPTRTSPNDGRGKASLTWTNPNQPERRRPDPNVVD